MHRVLIDSTNFETNLTSIADAIRATNGTTEAIEFPKGYIDAVELMANEYDYFAKVLNREIDELVCENFTGEIMPNFQTNNINLKKVDLPNARYCNGGFHSCANLSEVNMPSLITLQGSAFYGTALESIYLPSLESIKTWGSCFKWCESLKKAYFPKLTTLLDETFSGCSNLKTVILGADTVCTLNSNNVFLGTPIKNGTGYVYVRKTLADGSDGVTTYQAATNWSTIANQIRAIEDYPEIQAWINELEEVG